MTPLEKILLAICVVVMVALSSSLRSIAVAGPESNACVSALDMVDASMSEEARDSVPLEVWQSAYSLCFE